jgi:hypothetical protein
MAQAAANADAGLVSDLQLTSHVVGTPSGGTLHLVWPDGPDGKPKPEAKGVFQFPAGTIINEQAVPVCNASDTELQLEGRAACPDGSALGPGDLALITGVGAPVDPLRLDDFWFHGPGQLVGLISPQGSQYPVLAVNRVQIQGATLIAQPSLPPGYPPGTKTAPKESNQRIDRLVSSAGAFITTPPTCPSSGAWISHTTITYDDGSTDSATSATPCTGP